MTQLCCFRFLVFMIGHKSQYKADTGGELSLANCNANFGENALLSDGFKKLTFTPDNAAYITYIIPPNKLLTLQNVLLQPLM